MKEKSVNHPDHYCKGRKYEPKDVIRDWDLNFNLGSAVKYLARAGRKGDIVEDLLKAREYIDFEIEAILNEESLPKLSKEEKSADSTKVPDMLKPHCSPDPVQRAKLYESCKDFKPPCEDFAPNYEHLVEVLTRKHVINRADFDSHK